jgi:hypothetical protein
VVVITAKRLRPEAQGCFNPGEIGYDISTLKGLRRLTNRNGKFGCDARRNRVAVESVLARCPGLKQPWASGRNRVAVESVLARYPGLKQPWASGRNRFAV